jgi:hypothetical protein
MREYSYLLHFQDNASIDILTAVIATDLMPSRDVFEPLELLGVDRARYNPDGTIPKLKGKKRAVYPPYFVYGYCREDRTSFSNFGAIVYPETGYLISEATFIQDRILSMSYPRGWLDGDAVDVNGYYSVKEDNDELNQFDLKLSEKNSEIIENTISRLKVIIDAEFYADDNNYIKLRRSKAATLKDFDQWESNLFAKNWDSTCVNLSDLSSLWRARLHFE